MMFTPWGPRAVPTGGAGVAAPAFSCTLTSAAIFFLGGMVASGPLTVVAGGAGLLGSDLLDLREAQLDRGLPAEDLDQRLDPLGVGVDLGEGGVQGRERPVDHHDGVGDAE